jgi:hypothetical protein
MAEKIYYYISYILELILLLKGADDFIVKHRILSLQKRIYFKDFFNVINLV